MHFLLFYTDIFNALQAVIQAYFTNRVSQRLWVQTEEVQLDHYVEIREEYERVHQLLYDSKHNQNNRGLLNPNRLRLKSKYRKLMVQVRFHELRVNFLQAYKLPVKLRVSDYLMRSEQSVMISLVHITPTAWLWLTALCNLMYYLAGVLADVQQEAEVSAYFYSICFFVGMVIFVFVSIAVDLHMRRVFMKIMKSKHLWAFDLDDGKEFEQNKELADEQRNLFFLGDPQIIITIIQFMQFGYAIALSVVVVYYEDMQKDDDFAAWPYLFSSVLCYAAFVYWMARVIPRYTLCTNLGQLVDPQLLNETVARFKLQDAERHRENRMDGGLYGPPPARTTFEDGDASTMTPPYQKDLMMAQTMTIAENDSDSSPMTEATTVANTVTPSVSGTNLMQMEVDALSARELQRQNRRRTRKSQRAQSEGVALMQRMGDMKPPPIDEHGYASDEDEIAHKKRTKSSSAGVNMMMGDDSSRAAASVQCRDTMLVDLVKMDLQQVKAALKKDSDSVQVVVKERADRKKSTSASSLIKTMREMGVAATVTSVVSKPVKKLDDDEVSLAFSDVDDVLERKPRHDEEPNKPFSMSEWLSEFFVGRKFRFCSHVFGTLICFFLVAMRVEGFLQKSCIVPEDDYSWDLPLTWSFTLIVIWLSIALAISVVVVLTFACKNEMNRRHYKAVTAAFLDLAIVSTCLVLFLYAESQRCCSDSESDAENYYPTKEQSDLFYEGRSLQYGEEEKVCKDATLECACADFGFRVHSGLGSIEPWTALIALQAFRFIVANKICQHFQWGVKNYHTHHSHGHGHGPAYNPLEVVADAWQEAVTKHPELVAKYGEFSGELLQAMLQLDVVERRRQSEMSAPLLLPEDNGSPPEKHSGAMTPFVAPHTIELGIREPMNLSYPFEFPRAKIIRSIRRCDRMYLPLLKKWSPVDVILTKHELVYVQIQDQDDESMADTMQRAKSMQALMETKGGKELRLCDVTRGRKILGHLNLDDIETVRVEREMVSNKVKANGVDDVDVEASTDKIYELWEPSTGPPFNGKSFAKRWDQVQQDRLRIDTHRGTLYLRFYADLYDWETHPENVKEDLHRDHAFNWAQTLVRLCVDQLKQPLPHFGDGDTGELRDYLQIVDV